MVLLLSSYEPIILLEIRQITKSWSNSRHVYFSAFCLLWLRNESYHLDSCARPMSFVDTDMEPFWRSFSKYKGIARARWRLQNLHHIHVAYMQYVLYVFYILVPFFFFFLIKKQENIVASVNELIHLPVNLVPYIGICLVILFLVMSLFAFIGLGVCRNVTTILPINVQVKLWDTVRRKCPILIVL